MAKYPKMDMTAFERIPYEKEGKGERGVTLKGKNMTDVEQAEIAMMESAIESGELDGITDDAWLKRCDDLEIEKRRLYKAKRENGLS